MRKNLWTLGTATAVAAAALAACGGGGDGGGGGFPILPPIDGGVTPPPAPPPAPPPPPPAPPPVSSATSSAACTNEADYRAGTVLDYEGKTISPGQPDETSRTVRTTGERESFAGANPVPFVTPPLVVGEVVSNGKLYSDLAGGNVVLYGSLGSITTPNGKSINTGTYEPPPAFPVDMQVGESVSRNYNNKTVVVGTGEGGTTTGTVVVAVSHEIKYEGRETLQTAVGTFNVCKFTAKLSSTPENGAAFLTKSESWIAAEGPYRGQQLKNHFFPGSGSRETTFEVTKITYTPR